MLDTDLQQRFVLRPSKKRSFLKRILDEWQDKTDSQKFILENIIVYSLGVVFVFLLDFFYNLLYRFGFSLQKHPYHIGLFQILVLIFLFIQLARSFDHWRYYR